MKKVIVIIMLFGYSHIITASNYFCCCLRNAMKGAESADSLSIEIKDEATATQYLQGLENLKKLKKECPHLHTSGIHKTFWVIDHIDDQLKNKKSFLDGSEYSIYHPRCAHDFEQILICMPTMNPEELQVFKDAWFNVYSFKHM